MQTLLNKTWINEKTLTEYQCKCSDHDDGSRNVVHTDTARDTTRQVQQPVHELRGKLDSKNA